MADKIKLALYWGGTCGGCDVAVLDIDENILDVAALADVVFWPIAMDHKVKDVEAMEENEITCSIYNGVIRNTENLHIAKLLREKSLLMVAPPTTRFPLSSMSMQYAVSLSSPPT